MNRLDNLLAQALATGEIPEDATEAERAEITRLVGPSAALKANAAHVNNEASASMPVARARFERFMAEASRPAPVRVAAPRAGLLGRLLQFNRGLVSAGAAIAIGLIAILAVGGSQVLLSGTETASAQVLTEDDYVQVQGVVSSTTDQQLKLHSAEFGDITVAVTSSTSVVDDQSTRTAASLKPGDSVLVGGVVGKKHTISASTVAIAAPGQAPPPQARLNELKKPPRDLEGKVAVLTVSKNGDTARVLIDAGDGQRYIVNVNGKTAEMLLDRTETAIGTRVKVAAGSTPQNGVFALTLAESPTPQPTVRPSATTTTTTASAQPARTLPGARGVVVGREGNVLEIVDAQRRSVSVVVRPETRILLGESGLTREAIGKPEVLIGHTVTVTGGLDAKTGRILADAIVIGPRPPKP
jgi:RNase P/RNase MRP subunit p29